MLKIPQPVYNGTLIGRANRFTAWVDLGGRRMLAHIPTSSRLAELIVPGYEAILTDGARPGRLTQYNLIMVRHGSELVSVDSGVPNRLMRRVFRQGTLPEFEGWTLDRPEVVLGDSRLDFLLKGPDGRCWVEVKSVTLVEDGIALFPDAPTSRGVKHLGELARAKENGDRAAAVFVVQRSDADAFSPHRSMDPVFADALNDAVSRGVEAYAYRCSICTEEIHIERRIEVRL